MMGSREKDFINEELLSLDVKPERLDDLLANGWRHFGIQFFRFSFAMHDGEVREVIPLRVRLSGFALSRSQRRTLARNADTRIEIRPAMVEPDSEAMFRRHAARFSENPPGSLFTYLSPDRPDVIPCETKELRVIAGGEPIAISYFDVGSESVSGIYAMFEPAEARRRLGIYTILKEIEFAIRSGKKFYYLGYAYEGNSFYDYKKQFIGSEAFDWEGGWFPFDRR